MAAALKQAGIEGFVVLDRGDELGGIWPDNTYPGLCCDVPSALHSSSFWPWRWSRRFPLARAAWFVETVTGTGKSEVLGNSGDLTVYGLS
jgi:cation diffusion facilitator CzcD-associated flavoprotein CzcO